MRLKNKGFSLVELLVAMAAFAIVMVGIISLMRSSSISFRNESMEVDLERDSQLLMAQVEEFIVDCKSIAPDTSDVTATVAYSVTEPDGTSHSIKQIGTNVLLDGEVLADNVEYFFVNGLTQNDGLKDNVCMLDVKLNSKAGGTTGKEFTYKGYKQVYFRNDIDHVIADGLPDLDTVTPGPGPGNEKTLILGRYEVVNLAARFGVDTVVSWTPSGTDGIAFCDTEGYIDSHGGLTDVFYLTSPDTSLYITTNTTCNSMTSDTYSGTLVCSKTTTDDDGVDTTTNVTIIVTVPKVELKLGHGIVQVPPKAYDAWGNPSSINNTTANGSGGYYSYLEFTGFCARDYEKYQGENIKGKITVKLDGTEKGSMEGDIVNVLSTSFASGWGGQITLGGTWDRIEQFGLFYDYEKPDYLVIKWHNGEKPETNYFDSHEVTMTISVTYPHNGGEATQTKVYKCKCCGSDLSDL